MVYKRFSGFGWPQVAQGQIEKSTPEFIKTYFLNIDVHKNKKVF